METIFSVLRNQASSKLGSVFLAKEVLVDEYKILIPLGSPWGLVVQKWENLNNLRFTYNASSCES